MNGEAALTERKIREILGIGENPARTAKTGVWAVRASIRHFGLRAVERPGASRATEILIPGRAPERSRALARAAEGRIAESLPEVTEGRRSAMREHSRSEPRESREGDV